MNDVIRCSILRRRVPLRPTFELNNFWRRLRLPRDGKVSRASPADLTGAPGYFVGGETAPDYRYAAEHADRTGFDSRLGPSKPDSDEVFSLIDHVVEPNLVRGAVCSLLFCG
jgi:hypothetical protein